ncbi:MAG TPA: amino acid adenylation domain-containing protein [Streptosporangiaceae bacterium]|nr:amino acid adenylation domain-containing protein [Streptosporangiaceae bacterium]
MRRVRRVVSDALAHQDVPFDQVVERVRPQRDASRSPLFQILFTFVERGFGDRASEPLDGLRAGAQDVDVTALQFDMALMMRDAGSHLEAELFYATDLFDESTARSMGQRLVRLLSAAAADPDRPVSDLDLLTPQEREALRTGGNGEPSGTGAAALPLPGIFERQARRSPAAPAVAQDGRELTYAQLNRQANKLARVLIARGIGPEDVVALALPRDPQLIVAILAVLKSGAAYLPLDPGHPRERLDFMLTNARAALVLATAATAAGLPGAAPALILDAPSHRADRAAARGTNVTEAERRTPLRADHLAYVIYTSGSTGRPKAVAVTHRGIPVLFANQVERHAAVTGSRVLQLVSPSSDVMVAELCMALLAGGCLVLPGATLAGEELARFLARETITHAHIPPAVLATLPRARLPHLRVLITGGENCPPDLVRHWRSGRLMVNAYGPSETTCDVSSSPWREDDAPEHPVIGRPIAHVRVYVLDDRLGLVPPGTRGELYVDSPGLARGYLGRPDATAERFVANPFGPPGSRLYRTGDLARWRADRLEFLGRADDQIKIRGFRIEPGEIEAALARCPGLGPVAVIAREDRPGDRRLVAYVCRGAGGEPDPASLRRQLAARLPAHLVPAAFVVLDALPLTPNRKLDRAALPAPAAAPAGGGRPPRDEHEKVLSDLFAEVLGIEEVGVEDNFFDLGGHSLLATRLVSRVRAVLGVELGIRRLFDLPTVADLARVLGDAPEARPPLRPARRPARPPLSFAQRRLWFLNRLEGAADHVQNIALGLRLTGLLDIAALTQAIGDITGRHETLRTVFPDEDGVPYQQVLEPGDGQPAVTATSVTEAALPAALRAAAARGFDLTSELPLRVLLFALGPRRHVLLLVVHHIAFDGWSMAPLGRDLDHAYRARRGGRAPAWAALPVQYTDYTRWQRQVLGSEADSRSLASRQLGYWRAVLDGLPEQLDVPADYPRPAEPSYVGDSIMFTVTPELHEALRALAARSRVSLFMVFQAALAALLTRLGAGTDLPIGTPVAGRTDQALDDLVGCFINNLVLRTDTSGDPSFAGLLARVRETDLGAYAHQDLPFERLVEALNPARALGRHPLFQIMLVFQNNAAPGLSLGALDVAEEPVSHGVADYDLTLDLVELYAGDGAARGMTGYLQYAAELFGRDTAQAFADRFTRLLAAAAARPDTPIGELDILAPGERVALLDRWQDRAADVTGPARPGRVYVLDEHLRLAAPGARGELYIAGAGPGGEPGGGRPSGGRAALIAQRWVADPFGPPGSRMRRTADLVRWRLDGTLQFLDRAAAAADPVQPGPARQPEPEASAARPPRHPREEVLSQLFAEVLGLDRVEADDGFFDLGGHSLVAPRLVSRIRSVLGVDMSLRRLFETPTIAGLAASLDGPGRRDGFDTLLPLRARGSRPPLFCIHPVGGVSWCYAGLLPHLDPGVPVYGLQARAGGGARPASLKAMAQDYLDQIRAVQPVGPYHLLGWSFGGLVAHEIAVRLEQAGGQVALLALLDSYPVATGAEHRGIRGRDEARALLLDSLGYVPGGAAATAPGREQRATELLERPDSVIAQLGDGFLDDFTGLVLDNSALMSAHTPQRYRGDAVLFVAEKSWDHRQSPAGVWQPHVGGQLTTHRVPCHHDRITQPAALAVIGPVLAALLDHGPGRPPGGGRPGPVIRLPQKGAA